ncbi:MAG: hypothetical protein E5X53_31150 [Mesorhizobium sp.]|uniref:hypothetical protein n=1 Tax=Mesorhizobium sp. TaxID=1871066 RepID=UPI0012299092|nr:hypothetical protein [Mesorhizobium sp.]TIP69702.1 MAG: hypothetical protein E5X55_30990 [Mesorhizobium sp.]TIQ04006.1 MAG: hypothetical protein E5X57_30120 [Mesorhizobium sp.]TIR48077.1 MAG: hypothetical protein E5X53_31150 [Mesorhizobium sp.]TJV93870.1 MAG: hypothetical protein E5X52_30755 [Mesorhizobium sp.]
MDEAALWQLMNAARDRMNFAQKKLWDAIRINPEKWTHHSLDDRENGIWVVALIGRSVVSYNDFEHGFDRSSFIKYGEISELGWGQADLDVTVQHILNELEIGHPTAPRVSSP